jgi:hypothetical protein
MSLGRMMGGEGGQSEGDGDIQVRHVPGTRLEVFPGGDSCVVMEWRFHVVSVVANLKVPARTPLSLSRPHD